MIYSEYQKSRDAAWAILLHEQICELPVRVIALCRQIGIEVQYDDTLPDGVDGKASMIGGAPIIFLNPLAAANRKKFTVAHELGHILLGHVGQYGPVHRGHAFNGNPKEQAANVFASRLLAPACVLWGCNVQTEQDIMRICGISREAAHYRMERMRELYRRNKFLTSPLEREVYRQFLPFITAYRNG